MLINSLDRCFGGKTRYLLGPTKTRKRCVFFVSLHRLEEEEEEEERLCALPREQGHEIFSWFLENYQLSETHTEEDTSAKF